MPMRFDDFNEPEPDRYLGPDNVFREKPAHVAYLRRCADAWEERGLLGESEAFDEADRVRAKADRIEGVETKPIFAPEILEAVLEELSDNEKSAVLILYASRMLPIADLSGRYRELGLLNQRFTLSRLGRAVAKRILEDDPEARDPNEAREAADALRAYGKTLREEEPS